MKQGQIKHNGERGSATVITLLALVILTLLGISALNRTRSDILVTGNERVYRANLARAEAAARQGIAEVKLKKAKPQDATVTWLHTALPNADNLMADENWGTASEPVIDAECRFIVVFKGITYGDADARGVGTKDLEYVIYGCSFAEKGAVIVQVGYILTDVT